MKPTVVREQLLGGYESDGTIRHQYWQMRHQRVGSSELDAWLAEHPRAEVLNVAYTVWERDNFCMAEVLYREPATDDKDAASGEETAPVLTIGIPAGSECSIGVLHGRVAHGITERGPKALEFKLAECPMEC